MNENVPNLDSRCAQFSYDLVKAVASEGFLSKENKSKLENLINKSLGVLQENGLYAFFLYLEYRLKDLGAKDIKSSSLNLLRHEDIGLLEQNNNHFTAVCKLTEKLDHLLLAHRLIEQMLIYARYHAKAVRET